MILVSDEQKYELAIDVAAEILPETTLDLLKLSLSLRVFSPAVQLFQQVSLSCDLITSTAFFVRLIFNYTTDIR